MEIQDLYFSMSCTSDMFHISKFMCRYRWNSKLPGSTRWRRPKRACPAFENACSQIFKVAKMKRVSTYFELAAACSVRILFKTRAGNNLDLTVSSQTELVSSSSRWQTVPFSADVGESFSLLWIFKMAFLKYSSATIAARDFSSAFVDGCSLATVSNKQRVSTTVAASLWFFWLNQDHKAYRTVTKPNDFLLHVTNAHFFGISSCSMNLLGSVYRPIILNVKLHRASIDICAFRCVIQRNIAAEIWYFYSFIKFCTLDRTSKKPARMSFIARLYLWLLPPGKQARHDALILSSLPCCHLQRRWS